MMPDWLSCCLSASLAWGAPADASAALHDWDDRRASAWAAADPAALRALYEPGSAAGRVDVAMLRAWRERGLRVEGLLVENVVTTIKTYPNFAPVWERLMTSS